MDDVMVDISKKFLGLLESISIEIEFANLEDGTLQCNFKRDGSGISFVSGAIPHTVTNPGEALLEALTDIGETLLSRSPSKEEWLELCKDESLNIKPDQYDRVVNESEQIKNMFEPIKDQVTDLFIEMCECSEDEE